MEKKIYFFVYLFFILFSIHGQVLWQLGTKDNSSGDFGDYGTGTTFSISEDWETISDWTFFPKGLNRSIEPEVNIVYYLDNVPENGLLFRFKLLHAERSVPEMAVFSNQLMAGLIQLFGTGNTQAEYEWKKTYELYIPKEFLVEGENILRLEAVQSIYADDEDRLLEYLYWEWDYLQLEILNEPIDDPVHGKATFLGTSFRKGEHSFRIDDELVNIVPYALKWLGIAYSKNPLRAGFWTDVHEQQPQRMELIQAYDKHNMTVTANHIGASHYNLEGGEIPQVTKDSLDVFIQRYGDYFQFYEVENEPCLIGDQPKEEVLKLTQYLVSNVPEHIKITAPGWAYWPTGGDPDGWCRDPEARAEIEEVAQATNGHSYGKSYADNEGGSFIENLRSYEGVDDGWIKPFVNTETGTNDSHTDMLGFQTQSHASAFDRIIRAHVSVVDYTMQHSAFFGNYGLFNKPDWQDPVGSLRTWPGVNGQDPRLQTFRRLALTYATHGKPIPFSYINKEELNDKKIYVRAVDTRTLEPTPAGTSSNKLILSFVNFENSQITVNAAFVMPDAGEYMAERFGNEFTYAEAHSITYLEALPEMTLEVEIPPRGAVHYILQDSSISDYEERAPFNLIPENIPGIIEAENFDRGVSDSAFYDSDHRNTGGHYRTGPVDIDKSADINGGYKIVDTENGEWLEYTIDISQTDVYDLFVRTSALSDSALINLTFKNNNLSYDIEVPATGGFNNYTNIFIPGISLDEGIDTMRVSFIKGGLNLNHLRFIKPESSFSENINIPGNLEFENYNNGSNGISYLDLSPGNSGNTFRFDDVDIFTEEDMIFVGDVEEGEWLTYTTDILAPGNYQLTARVNMPEEGQIEISLDGEFQKQLNIEPTNGWENLVIGDIDLETGLYLLKIEFTKGVGVYDFLGFSPGVQNQSGIYQQEPGKPIAFEAEEFSVNTPKGSHFWNITTEREGYSGSGSMMAIPSIGENNNNDFVNLSPGLNYGINFIETGTFYVWVRMHSNGNGAEDSVHAGLNGEQVNSCDRISGPIVDQWRWVNETMDGPIATLEVKQKGYNVFNLWMREDGTVIDKIILTKDPDFIPEGMGPDNSIREVFEYNQLPSIDFLLPEDTIVEAGTNLIVQLDAYDTDGQVEIVELYTNGELTESYSQPYYDKLFRRIEEGEYIFTGIAYDNDGGVSETNPLVVNVYDTGTSIKEIKISDLISVIPNPFTEKVSIQIPSGVTIREISIYNQTGILINKLKPDTDEIIWDGSDFSGTKVPPGLYLISGIANFEGQNKNWSVKVTKK